jgi:CheY-like chemotaxis protein
MPVITTSAWRVLLVDDDPLVRDSIRRILEFDQRKVEVAISAKDALALCEKETFDLIILDYLMPEMKGDQLAVTLKERYPRMPVIMITADVERMQSAQEKPAGVDLVIGKPFQMDEFREAVSKVLFKE